MRTYITLHAETGAPLRGDSYVTVRSALVPPPSMREKKKGHIQNSERPHTHAVIVFAGQHKHFSLKNLYRAMTH